MARWYGSRGLSFFAVVLFGAIVAVLVGRPRSTELLQTAAQRGQAALGLNGAGGGRSRLIVDVAPATPQPYVLPNLRGEAHDFGGLVLRTLLPNTTSEGRLSIVGVSSGPLPLALAHYHEEVEAFYALKGSVETFHNDDQGREVRANDFVLLAPRNVHNYRPVDLDFQLTLCMAPGGIDDFFRSIGEKYEKAGPFDPIHQSKPNPVKVLGAMPRYNVTPKIGYPINMNWTNGTTEDGRTTWHRSEQTLPSNDATPYFISSNRGPKYLHRSTGQVVAQLATDTQTKGLLSVATIALKPGKTFSAPIFASDHAIQVTEGQLHLEIRGDTAPLIFGDFAFIPQGTSFRYHSTVSFTKFVLWSSGPGLAEHLISTAEPWAHGVWAP